jgi:hypothetical protein
VPVRRAAVHARHMETAGSRVRIRTVTPGAHLMAGRAPRGAARRAAGAALAAALAACSGIGPDTLPRDRFEYSDGIAQSWKKQALLNIVKLRYVDVPVFLEVGQIVSGYTLETALAAGASVDLGPDGNILQLGGSTRFQDRPTITYSPLTGDRFLRGLLTPLPSRSIMLMLQAGYAADFTLGWTVESFNGLRNCATTVGNLREPEPAFVRALQLLTELQRDASVSLAVKPGPEGADATVIVLRRDNATEEQLAKGAELRQLLGQPDAVHELTLITSPGRGAVGELAIQPRSVLQVMMGMAAGVDVPAQHVAEQRALPAPGLESDTIALKVHSGLEEPADAYIKVFYRDHWFWIDDRDWRSKRSFVLMMFLFSLMESTSTDPLPVLTIPTG